MKFRVFDLFGNISWGKSKKHPFPGRHKKEGRKGGWAGRQSLKFVPSGRRKEEGGSRLYMKRRRREDEEREIEREYNQVKAGSSRTQLNLRQLNSTETSF